MVMSIMLSNCTKQSENNGGTPSQEEVFELTELVANIPEINIGDDETKTSVSPGGQFSWVAMDQLGFWPAGGDVTFLAPKQFIFYVDPDKPISGNSASFKANGWGLLSGHTYYSYYPYDNTATSESVTLNYTGQVQTVTNNTDHLGQYDYMHSSVEVPKENIQLTFSRIGCIARFTLNLKGEYKAGPFNRMEISSTESILVESARYNPSTTSVTLQDKSMTKTLSVALGNHGAGISPSNDQIVVFAMMSPAAWGSKEITIKLYTDGGQVLQGTFTPKSNQVVGKGYGYTAEVSGGGVVDEYTDLSEDGTRIANCYMITTAGKYKFKAVKKGNGVAVNGENIDIPTNSVHAEILWQTNNSNTGTSILDGISYEDGFIKFETKSPYISGNAIIAIENNENTILWSWHIWSPGSAVASNSYGQRDLMDRNLGAIISMEPNGLLYQWGRKDPFLNSEMTSTIGNIPNSTVIRSLGIYPWLPEKTTPLWASQNPTVFIKGDPGWYDDDEEDWNEGNCHWEADNTLNLWNINESSAMAERKTMYDPCPYGYKVPDAFDSNFESGEVDSENKRTKINGVFWPFAGSRNEDSGSLEPGHQYWACTARRDSNFAKGMYVGSCIDIDALDLFWNHYININSVSYCSSAKSVRCEKIK